MRARGGVAGVSADRTRITACDRSNRGRDMRAEPMRRHTVRSANPQSCRCRGDFSAQWCALFGQPSPADAARPPAAPALVGSRAPSSPAGPGTGGVTGEVSPAVASRYRYGGKARAGGAGSRRAGRRRRWSRTARSRGIWPPKECQDMPGCSARSWARAGTPGAVSTPAHWKWHKRRRMRRFSDVPWIGSRPWQGRCITPEIAPGAPRRSHRVHVRPVT